MPFPQTFILQQCRIEYLEFVDIGLVLYRVCLKLVLGVLFAADELVGDQRLAFSVFVELALGTSFDHFA